MIIHGFKVRNRQAFACSYPWYPPGGASTNTNIGETCFFLTIKPLITYILRFTGLYYYQAAYSRV